MQINCKADSLGLGYGARSQLCVRVDRLGKAAGAKKARHSVLSSYFPPVGWASHLTCLFLLAGPEKKTNYSPLYQMSKGPWPQLCPNEVRKRVSLGPDMQVQILSVTG